MQKGAPCPREGCRRVLWSGVFPQSLLISCLERSWIYFTASADKQFSCSFCAGLVGKSCTGVAGRAWFCLGMVHRPLSLLLPSHTLDSVHGAAFFCPIPVQTVKYNYFLLLFLAQRKRIAGFWYRQRRIAGSTVCLKL